MIIPSICPLCNKYLTTQYAPYSNSNIIQCDYCSLFYSSSINFPNYYNLDYCRFIFDNIIVHVNFLNNTIYSSSFNIICPNLQLFNMQSLISYINFIILFK